MRSAHDAYMEKKGNENKILDGKNVRQKQY
jgi:hypothetical protein